MSGGGMSKRFTATEKWDDPWYRKLPCKYRDFWQYTLDKCDNSGIWIKDMETASYFIGEQLTEQEALALFNVDKERIKTLNNGSRWLIVDFVSYQFGTLTNNNPLHRSILALQDKNEKKGYMRGINTPQVKDMVKEKVKEKEMDKERGVGETIERVIEDLNDVLGTSYKHSSKQTKEHIKSRINDGFTLEDFKKVHRIMLRNWGADQKMCKYLRPQTLYSPKFESYLNMREISTKLTENGIKAYIVGQEWLRKQEAKPC
jgi:uncharacterized phage protein (TIGR02220 family)